MKLRNVSIRNFRGMCDLTLTLDNYSLLVGPNNAGKSSVLDAIRAFYEKDRFKFNKDHDLPKHKECTESWVELAFQLNDEEFDSLAEDYKTSYGTLRLRKYFLQAGKFNAGSIYAYTSNGNLSENSFYGAKNGQSGKIGEIVYIPAISRVDEHAKLSGPSALRDLLQNIMDSVVSRGQAYNDFSASVRRFSAEIHKEATEDDRSLAGLETRLNEMLGPWDSEFRLDFSPPTAAETIKSLLGWELIDKFHGQPQEIEYYGSGFQRHFIFSLIQLGSEYAGERTNNQTRDFSPTLKLLLFEEPEAFLHPPQQETLGRNLMSLTSSSDEWQVVCATHSSSFVSKNTSDIGSIVRLRHSPSNREIESFQIGSSGWNEIVNENQKINKILKSHSKNVNADDERAEMEAIKYFLWLNSDRSNLFFADHVLLVEGPTEVAMINRLIDDGKINYAREGLCVIDCMGKYNVHRFMKLLIAMGISHSVIYDDDSNKAEHSDINELIKDSADQQFTVRVEALPGSLEGFLDLPSPGRNDRKPQHALYYYDTGNIGEDRVQDFCRIVEQCMPQFE